MKRLLNFAAVLHVSLAALSAAVPRPINDGVSNTLLLAEREGSYENQGGSSATAEKGETPIAGSDAAHTVWYAYKAPVAGRFVVEIKDEQGLRAELRLPANPPTTIPLQTFADGTSNTIVSDERLSTDLVRGQIVYLVVDAEKPFNFSWRFLEAKNDTFKDAEFLADPSGTVVRADKGATRSASEAELGLGNPGTWYLWTASSSVPYYVDLVGSRERQTQAFSGFSVRVFGIDNGSPGTLLGLGSGSTVDNSTRVSFNAVAGQSYYFLCTGGTEVPNNDIWLSWYPQNAQGVLAFAHPEYRVAEGSGPFAPLVLQLRGSSGGDIAYTTSAGPSNPATAGADYSVDGTPVFFIPDVRAISLPLNILADFTAEPTESVTLGLSTSLGIQDGTSNTIFITERDNSGACGFVNTEYRVREGTTARVEVRRIRDGNKQTVVNWEATEIDGATLGEDLSYSSGTVVLDPGQLSTFIDVPIYQDGQFEGPESIGIRLTDSPQAGSIVDGTSNTILLIEDQDYFVPRAGKYCGLINTNGWGSLVKMSLTNAGAVTGKLDYRGISYPFRGAVDADGHFVCALQRGTRAPLGLRVAFGESWNTCDISFRDPEGSWADGTARLLPYDGKRSIAPQKGKYTVICMGQTSVPRPFIMAGTALGDGSVRFIGRMADNTPVSFGGAVAIGDGSVRGECAFSVPLYKKTGNFYGTLQLGLGPNQLGTTSEQWWLKPWRPTDVIYPALPFQTCLARAIPYTPPPAGTRITTPFENSAGSGSINFGSGGTILDGTSNTLLIGERNQVTFPTNPNQCSVRIDPKTGLFTGKITPPAGTPTTFYGVFLQEGYGYGIGYWLGTDKAGQLTITAAP